MPTGGRVVRHTLVAVLVLGVVAGIVYMLSHTKEDVPEGPVPTFLPDFSFPDASGKPVTLFDQKGDVRVVNFWASWSPYSKEELPALVALKKEFGERVGIVALNRDTYPRDGQEFLISIGLGDELVFAYDKEDTYFREVGGYNMPETIFVGEGGEVLHHEHGPMKYEDMKRVVEGLLSDGER